MKTPKALTDEFWKITELRKLKNLCKDEMETTTMSLKLRYERDINLMQQAETYGREQAKSQTEIEKDKEFLEFLISAEGLMEYYDTWLAVNNKIPKLKAEIAKLSEEKK